MPIFYDYSSWKRGTQSRWACSVGSDIIRLPHLFFLVVFCQFALCIANGIEWDYPRAKKGKMRISCSKCELFIPTLVQCGISSKPLLTSARLWTNVSQKPIVLGCVGCRYGWLMHMVWRRIIILAIIVNPAEKKTFYFWQPYPLRFRCFLTKITLNYKPTMEIKWNEWMNEIKTSIAPNSSELC